MALRIVAAWLLLLLGCAAASAHASLVSSEPADGAILDEAPRRLVLIFNEPVAPLVLQLVSGDATVTPLGTFRVADQSVIIEPPARLDSGSYVLSWRVVSEDGHPIGGSVVFSIGTAGGAAPDIPYDADVPVRTAILIFRVIIYASLFCGIGGLFFGAFVAAPPPAAIHIQIFALGVTPIALLLSVGLQGLDGLGLPLPDIVRPEVWRTGFGTTYGTAAIIALLAVLAALVGLGARRPIHQALSLLSLVALGVAFASTGHAGAAPPQWLTRPAVFIHTVAVAVWVGALLPLGLLLLSRDQPRALAALTRFSAAIPYAVVPLVLAGMVLAVVQIGTPAAAWTTGYGQVFLAKCVLLLILFTLATVNRFRMTAPALAGDAVKTRRLASSVAIEIVIVAAILSVVALWRFTPPPRSLVAVPVAPATVHIHTDKAAAEITITPGRAGPVTIAVVLSTPDSAPLAANEVTLTVANPAAGIEPIRRDAAFTDDAWTAEGVMLPVPGTWRVRVSVLVSDFDMITLDGVATIAP